MPTCRHIHKIVCPKHMECYGRMLQTLTPPPFQDTLCSLVGVQSRERVVLGAGSLLKAAPPRLLLRTDLYEQCGTLAGGHSELAVSRE